MLNNFILFYLGLVRYLQVCFIFHRNKYLLRSIKCCIFNRMFVGSYMPIAVFIYLNVVSIVQFSFCLLVLKCVVYWCQGSVKDFDRERICYSEMPFHCFQSTSDVQFDSQMSLLITSVIYFMLKRQSSCSLKLVIRPNYIFTCKLPGTYLNYIRIKFNF